MASSGGAAWERLQLTRSTARALLPIWTPDSTHIVFQRFSLGTGWKAQIISTENGEPEDILPGGGGGVDFNWTPEGGGLIFSNGPEFGPTSIRIMDLNTHAVSLLPGSEGLFSPRRSPDGRYLAALSQDSSTLMLYDLRRQKWSKWLVERGNIAVPTWAKDSSYLYFDNFLTDRPTARRVKLGETHSEEMFSLAGLRRFHGTPSGTWGGLSPDGSRLYVQDLSTQEIYSLQLQLR